MKFSEEKVRRMREKKRVDQEQVFDRLPVPSALRVRST